MTCGFGPSQTSYLQIHLEHTYIRTNITFIYPQIYSVVVKANMSETEENKEFIKVKINNNTGKPLLSGHLWDLPKCPLNRECPLNRGL